MSKKEVTTNALAGENLEAMLAGVTQPGTTSAPEPEKEVQATATTKKPSKPKEGGADQPSIKKKEDAAKPVIHKKAGESEWEAFVRHAKELRADENKDKGVQVWVTKEIKQQLDLIKTLGVNVPIRHLVSAAIMTFFEANAKDIEKLKETIK